MTAQRCAVVGLVFASSGFLWSYSRIEAPPAASGGGGSPPPPEARKSSRRVPGAKHVTVTGERVRLEVSREAVGATSIPYVCATLDWWPDAKSDWGAQTWNRSTVTTLGLEDDDATFAALAAALRQLAPVALRVGGSLQDLVAYDVGEGRRRRKPFDGCPGFAPRAEERVGFEGGCLGAALYDRVDDLALAAGRTRVIRRRFNVGVLEAIPKRNASTL